MNKFSPVLDLIKNNPTNQVVFDLKNISWTNSEPRKYLDFLIEKFGLPKPHIANKIAARGPDLSFCTQILLFACYISQGNLSLKDIEIYQVSQDPKEIEAKLGTIAKKNANNSKSILKLQILQNFTILFAIWGLTLFSTKRTMLKTGVSTHLNNAMKLRSSKEGIQ